MTPPISSSYIQTSNLALLGTKGEKVKELLLQTSNFKTISFTNTPSFKPHLAVFSSLLRTHALERLTLDNLQLSLEIIKQLGEGLQCNQTLEALDLSHNPGIGCDGAKAIANGIRRHPKLSELRLIACNIANEGGTALKEAIEDSLCHVICCKLADNPLEKGLILQIEMSMQGKKVTPPPASTKTQLANAIADRFVREPGEEIARELLDKLLDKIEVLPSEGGFHHEIFEEGQLYRYLIISKLACAFFASLTLVHLHIFWNSSNIGSLALSTFSGSALCLATDISSCIAAALKINAQAYSVIQGAPLYANLVKTALSRNLRLPFVEALEMGLAATQEKSWILVPLIKSIFPQAHFKINITLNPFAYSLEFKRNYDS